MLEVGRRRGLAWRASGMPGHFLVGDRPGGLLRPVPRGVRLDEDGCRLVFETTRGAAPFLPEYLAPVGRRMHPRPRAREPRPHVPRARPRPRRPGRCASGSASRGSAVADRREAAALLGSLGHFAEGAAELDALGDQLEGDAADRVAREAASLRAAARTEATSAPVASPCGVRTIPDVPARQRAVPARGAAAARVRAALPTDDRALHGRRRHVRRGAHRTRPRGRRWRHAVRRRDARADRPGRTVRRRPVRDRRRRAATLPRPQVAARRSATRARRWSCSTTSGTTTPARRSTRSPSCSGACFALHAELGAAAPADAVALPPDPLLASFEAAARAPIGTLDAQALLEVGRTDRAPHRVARDARGRDPGPRVPSPGQWMKIRVR